MKIKVDPSIFRDYDIRGTYPDQLNEEAYYVIGRAVASYLGVPQIAVGYDTRLSSPSLFKALTSGIMDQGTDVVNLGLISTEMHYFASGFYKFPANIIISASHNPPNYNGLKIVTKGVVPLSGENGLPEIRKLSLGQNFKHSSRKGKMTKKEIMDDWIEHAFSFIDRAKLGKMKVAVDAGNGMGGISWEKLRGKLNMEIIPLYFEPDGHFPHHLADPIKPENLRDLIQVVITKKADVGLALDGDADRLFIVDEKGNRVSGTVATALLARALLRKYGKAPVLYNAVCGKIVPEIIKKSGGTPVRVRVGHSFIKKHMKKHHALFAGEHSGHFYFRDNYGAESSLIAGLIILEYISKRNKKLSDIVKELDKYPSSGEINFWTDNPDKIITQVESEFKDADAIDHLDGLSVWYNDWWLNLRSSKTEPYVRLNIEADNKNILKDKTEYLSGLLKRLGARRA